MKRVFFWVVGVLFIVFCAGEVFGAAITGSLCTPDSSGIVAGNDGWAASSGGFCVQWTISQNPDLSWHYKYEFFDSSGQLLDKETSHFIIALSEGVVDSDIINVGSDVSGWDVGTYIDDSGNPGFPSGGSMFGVKFEMTNNQDVVEFDIMRAPMWGDFYAKDGVSGGLWNYAYNTDFGVEVANKHDYMGIAVDSLGGSLHKILVPNTYVPEPGTVCLLSFGALGLLRRRKR